MKVITPKQYLETLERKLTPDQKEIISYIENHLDGVANTTSIWFNMRKYFTCNQEESENEFKNRVEITLTIIGSYYQSIGWGVWVKGFQIVLNSIANCRELRDSEAADIINAAN